MSLILEALKKAEREHRLGQVPMIDPAPSRPDQSGYRWPVILLLVGVALSMLALGVYLGSGPERKKVKRPSSVNIPEGRAREVRPMVQQAPQPTGAPSPATLQPRIVSQPTQVVASEQSDSSVPKVGAPGPASAPATPEPAPPPKRIEELPDGFVDHLPALNIDIHSYDVRPAKRYVLINLQKYHEGDYLAEGPRLSEIRPDGVVLEYLGERFILPIGNH